MAKKYDFDKGSYIVDQAGTSVKWSDIKGYYYLEAVDKNLVYVFTNNNKNVVDIYGVIATLKEFEAAYSAWGKNVKILANARKKKAEKAEKEKKNKELEEKIDEVRGVFLGKKDVLKKKQGDVRVAALERDIAYYDLDAYIKYAAETLGVIISVTRRGDGVPAEWSFAAKDSSLHAKNLRGAIRII